MFPIELIGISIFDLLVCPFCGLLQLFRQPDAQRRHARPQPYVGAHLTAASCVRRSIPSLTSFPLQTVD